MSEQLWWYVARSGGIVALALATLSILWGLALSTRITDGRPRPAWLLDMHRMLGGASVVFTAIHVAALMLDSYVSFGLTDVLVPFASSWNAGAVAWGIESMYLLAAVQVSSLAMKRLPRRLWRAIHMGSYGVFATGVVHGLQAGTDASHPLYVAGTVGSIVAVAFLTAYRVFGTALGRTGTRSPVRA